MAWMRRHWWPELLEIVHDPSGQENLAGTYFTSKLSEGEIL
jgi:hypothetical protein